MMVGLRCYCQLLSIFMSQFFTARGVPDGGSRGLRLKIITVRDANPCFYMRAALVGPSRLKTPTPAIRDIGPFSLPRICQESCFDPAI